MRCRLSKLLYKNYEYAWQYVHNINKFVKFTCTSTSSFECNVHVHDFFSFINHRDPMFSLLQIFGGNQARTQTDLWGGAGPTKKWGLKKKKKKKKKKRSSPTNFA